MLTTPTTLSALLLFLPLALSTPTPNPQASTAATTSEPYIGLLIHQGTVQAPCSSDSLSFNLKPPVSWLSAGPTAHCLPGLPGDIHNITCVTRRLAPLQGEEVVGGGKMGGLDVKGADMAKCDLWGYTDVNCGGKYWVAGRDDPLALVGVSGNGSQGGQQSWIWTEEEREAGPDLLDIRSWRVDCRA